MLNIVGGVNMGDNQYGFGGNLTRATARSSWCIIWMRKGREEKGYSIHGEG